MHEHDICFFFPFCFIATLSLRQMYCIYIHTRHAIMDVDLFLDLDWYT